MAKITGLTAARMLEISNESVVGGQIQGDNLILSTRGGTPIDAGNVRGPVGPVSAVSQEDWREVGASGQPAYIYAGLVGGTPKLRFRKGADGIVRLAGAVYNNSAGNMPAAATTVFTLPVGYRPTEGTRKFLVPTFSGMVRVEIQTNGDVQVLSSSNGYSTWQRYGSVDFDGVHFLASAPPSFPAGAVQPVPLVGSLPASPVDGQEVYTQSSEQAALGLFSKKRWRSSGAKWDVLAPEPIPFVSTLPASPVHGQQVYYQDATMAAAASVFHLMYRTDIAGPYKWLNLNGSYRLAVGGGGNTTATNFASAATLASLAIPLAGVYDVQHGGRMYHQNNAGASVDIALGVSGAELPNCRISHYQGSAGSSITLVATHQTSISRQTFTTPSVVQQRGFVNGGTGTIESLWMKATPVALG